MIHPFYLSKPSHSYRLEGGRPQIRLGASNAAPYFGNDVAVLDEKKTENDKKIENEAKAQEKDKAKEKNKASKKDKPKDEFRPKKNFVPGNAYHTPNQWEFFWGKFKQHFREGQLEGSEQFYDEMLYDRKKMIKLFTGVTALGLIFAAASTPLRRVLHMSALALLMPFPIIRANRTIPKLNESYKAEKQGNPQKADRVFHNALREFNYSLFQEFLKPVSLAILFTTAIALPQSLAKPKTKWLELGEYQVKNMINKLAKHEKYPTTYPHLDNDDTRSVLESLICWPIEKLDRLFAPNNGQWSNWAGGKLERIGWKRSLQPYPLLKQFNNFIRRHGDRWEEGLRKVPYIKNLLGKRVPPHTTRV